MGPLTHQIVIVCDSLGAGGAEKQILEIATQFSARSIKTSILCLRGAATVGRYATQIQALANGGVSVIAADTVQGAIRVSLLLVKILLGRCHPVLWCWGAKADLVGFTIGLFNSQLRLVCSLRSASEARFDKLKTLYRCLIKRANLFISNSSLALCQLEKLIGATPRSFLLPNFLSQAELDAKAIALPDRVEHLHVGMLGNVRFEIKGYDLVLDAAKLLCRENLPIRIQIAGGGPEGGRLSSEIEKRGLGQIVEYIGPVADTEGFLRKQHVFLLASRFEGTPNALCEAMSLGLPCISTMVGDVAEINSQEEILYLCRIGESSDIRDRIVEVLNNWSEAKLRGSKGRQLARARFSAEAHMPALLQELANLEPSKGS
jgi:glycosyltransferase involved in cell wall biosynthesis